MYVRAKMNREERLRRRKELYYITVLLFSYDRTKKYNENVLTKICSQTHLYF